MDRRDKKSKETWRKTGKKRFDEIQVIKESRTV